MGNSSIFHLNIFLDYLLNNLRSLFDQFNHKEKKIYILPDIPVVDVRNDFSWKFDRNFWIMIELMSINYLDGLASKLNLYFNIKFDRFY
jgi:hypothetical protein